MKAFRLYMAVAVLGLSTLAHAQESIIGLHVGSYHSAPMANGTPYNNVNPGVYVMHKGWTVGTYFNSERKQTVYGGYTFQGETPIDGLNWGVTLGVATGYSRARVIPALVPSLSFNNPLGGVSRVSIIPPVSGMPLVLHYSHEWKF